MLLKRCLQAAICAAVLLVAGGPGRAAPADDYWDKPAKGAAATPAPPPAPVSPAAQFERDVRVRLLVSADWVDGVFAAAKNSDVAAALTMREARMRLLLINPVEVPPSLAGDPVVKRIAGDVMTVLAVRRSALGYGLDYLDERKPSDAAQMIETLGRAKQRSREIEAALVAWPGRDAQSPLVKATPGATAKPAPR